MPAVAPGASMRSPVAEVKNLQASQALRLILKKSACRATSAKLYSTVLLYTRLPSLSKSLSSTTGKESSFNALTFSREERCFPTLTPCGCRRLCSAWLVPNWCLAREPTPIAAGLLTDEVTGRWRRHPLQPLCMLKDQMPRAFYPC